MKWPLPDDPDHHGIHYHTEFLVAEIADLVHVAVNNGPLSSGAVARLEALLAEYEPWLSKLNGADGDHWRELTSMAERAIWLARHRDVDGIGPIAEM